MLNEYPDGIYAKFVSEQQQAETQEENEEAKIKATTKSIEVVMQDGPQEDINKLEQEMNKAGTNLLGAD